MASSYTSLEPSGLGPAVTIDNNFVGLGNSLTLTLVTAGILVAISFRFVPALIGFMSGDNESKRTQAKENFWAGLFVVGFILLLIPFATLVNSSIGEFNVTKGGAAGGGSASSNTGTKPATGTGGTVGSPANNGSSPLTGSSNFLLTTSNDAVIRSTLKTANIGVNNPMCSFEGATGCTSLGGMSQKTIDMLLALRAACSTCVITVSGGTEYWLHGKKGNNFNTTQHKPGGSGVDLQKNNTLDLFLANYLRDNPSSFLPKGACASKLQWGGFVFCDERSGTYDSTTGDHWHVQ